MTDETEETTTKPYAGGVAFVGHFSSAKQAERSMGKVEQYLTLEMGFQDVRGGITQQARALCGCERAAECDERVGCLFVSFSDEDEQYEDEA